ncbi:hypothetical protein Esti_001706 [Eimeria stiedai]
MGYKRPLVLLPLVAVGAFLYQIGETVGSRKPTGKEGLVQDQEVSQFSESKSSGSEIDQARHEPAVVPNSAAAPSEEHRVMQEQENLEQAAVLERELMSLVDEVAPRKRELAGLPPQGTTRLGSLWNEKLLRKEFKRVSEAIDQLQSPSSRAELYERLEQKLNQARFEGAISSDDEFLDTDSDGPSLGGDECDNCGYKDERRPSRRPGRGQQSEEEAQGNYAGIERPTRPTHEDRLVEKPISEGEEGERKHHSFRRPRHRRRNVAESSGESFDGVQASDSAQNGEGEEEEQPIQEEQETYSAQAIEAETGEDSIEATQRADQPPDTEVGTHEEDRAWLNEAASEDGNEHEPEATDKNGKSDSERDGESYNETHETEQAGGSEAVSEEPLDHEAQERQDAQDGALTDEPTDQESQGKNQASDAEVQPDRQNSEETQESDQVWEEEQAHHDEHANQDADQILPNEAGTEEQGFDGTRETHESGQAEQSEDKADEQIIHEPSIGLSEAQKARQSFRQIRQRKPAMPNRSTFQEESHSQTYGAGEPVRYAAETQGGAHRQTQRASSRRHHEPGSQAEVVGSTEPQRRGPVRRHAGSGSEEAVRHIRRGHVRSNETQSQRQGSRQPQRTSQARRYENETPRQSSLQVQRDVQVAQRMPTFVQNEEEDTTKEVLSYALREAQKLEQMANKMKHLYDYVVEQERLARTGATVGSSSISPRPTSREALEKMIERDIDNLLDSFRTLLSYAKEVQHTEEVQERRWGASTTSRASSPPQREEYRMQTDGNRSFTPQQVRSPTQRVERARSTSIPGRSVPQGRGSTVASRTSNASPGRRVPTSSSSHNARQSEDAADLTYKILDNYGDSNITVLALQDVNSTVKVGSDASNSAESSTPEEGLEKGTEEAQTKKGDVQTQEDSATSDSGALTDHGGHLGSLPAAPTRTLFIRPDAAPDSLTAANTKHASTVAGMNMDSDSQETSRPRTRSATGAEKLEVEDSRKIATTVVDPYHERRENSIEPSNDSNIAPSTLLKHDITMAFEALDKRLADVEVSRDAIHESAQNPEDSSFLLLGDKETSLEDADENESSAVRDLAGVRKRTKFNHANAESSNQEGSAQPVFAVTPFETSSSRPPPAGPPERWAGAYTIRLSPRVSGMTRSSDGSDYPNTPYRTYRSYTNPFSSPYSTHSFHEDYGERYSNSYYHDKLPRNAISWKEFVRRREEKKALEKRKQEEANEPKLGVIETEPPKVLGIINVNRRSSLRPATPSQAYRPHTHMGPSQTMGTQPISDRSRTPISFTPYKLAYLP